MCAFVSRRSGRLLEQIGIQLPGLLDNRLIDRIALHLFFVYPYEKQLFYIVNYRLTVLGYPRLTFEWVNNKNLILLLEELCLRRMTCDTSGRDR